MLIPFKENEPRRQQLPPHLFRFEKNFFIGNIRRVYVSRVLLLIVVVIATTPQNSQRPTISSYLLGCPPSLAKLRKATEYSSLFFQINKLQPVRIHTFQCLICFDLLPK